MNIWAENADSYPGYLKFQASRTNGTAYPASNDILGIIDFSDIHNGGSTRITAVASETHSSSANGAFLAFATTPNTTLTPQERVRIDQNGNVGIGATSPRGLLDVQGGTILSTPEVSNSTSTIDFSKGNIQYTSNSCGSFQFNNLKDGGSYTFIVKGTSSATCSFTAYSDAGSTALTVHMPPDNGATTGSKHTIFSIIVGGSDVYVAWTPGY
jgi:hypothetical protein